MICLVDVKPWTMIEGAVTEYKIDNIIWIPKPKIVRNIKQNYFIKWLKEIRIGETFLLEDFYEKYPKHKTDPYTKKRLVTIISGLVQDDILQQLGNGKFKVLK